MRDPEAPTELLPRPAPLVEAPSALDVDAVALPVAPELADDAPPVAVDPRPLSIGSRVLLPESVREAPARRPAADDALPRGNVAAAAKRPTHMRGPGTA
jgi:hypothetical protein